MALSFTNEGSAVASQSQINTFNASLLALSKSRPPGAFKASTSEQFFEILSRVIAPHDSLLLPDSYRQQLLQIPKQPKRRINMTIQQPIESVTFCPPDPTVSTGEISDVDVLNGATANPAQYDGCSLTSMPASPRSSNQSEQIKAACDRPGPQLKFDEDHRFLREVVYAGLKDLGIEITSWISLVTVNWKTSLLKKGHTIWH